MVKLSRKRLFCFFHYTTRLQRGALISFKKTIPTDSQCKTSQKKLIVFLPLLYRATRRTLDLLGQKNYKWIHDVKFHRKKFLFFSHYSTRLQQGHLISFAKKIPTDSLCKIPQKIIFFLPLLWRAQRRTLDFLRQETTNEFMV